LDDPRIPVVSTEQSLATQRRELSVGHAGCRIQPDVEKYAIDRVSCGRFEESPKGKVKVRCSTCESDLVVRGLTLILL
jgi:hypothetical protein